MGSSRSVEGGCRVWRSGLFPDSGLLNWRDKRDSHSGKSFPLVYLQLDLLVLVFDSRISDLGKFVDSYWLGIDLVSMSGFGTARMH